MAQVGDASEKTFSLDKVDRTVKLTKTVEIPPFSAIQVHGIRKVKCHDKRVNIIVEPENNGCNPSAVGVPSYTNLKPGSSKVNMRLRNFTSRSITVKARSITAQVAADYVVPPMLTPKNPQESEKHEDKRAKPTDMNFEAPIKVHLIKDQLEKWFDKIDLNRMKDWSKEDQEVQKLIKDFGFLFALNNVDLDKTSIVKHTIKLTDYTPFKERYCII